MIAPSTETTITPPTTIHGNIQHLVPHTLKEPLHKAHTATLKGVDTSMVTSNGDDIMTMKESKT